MSSVTRLLRRPRLRLAWDRRPMITHSTNQAVRLGGRSIETPVCSSHQCYSNTVSHKVESQVDEHPRRRPKPPVDFSIFRADSDIRDVLSKISAIQLRDTCSCIDCVDPSTKQRKFRTAQIPPNVSIRLCEFPERTKARVSWNHDIETWPGTHVSDFETSDLLQWLSPSKNIGSGQYLHSYWLSKEYERVEGNWVDFRGFTESSDILKQAMTNLSKYGLIFVTGIPAGQASAALGEIEMSAISNIATRIGPLYNSHYGQTWDVRSIPSAKNVAYTNVDLGFHMDLLYKEEPPYLQLLHCLRNSQSGGESLFVDTFRAASNLWKSSDLGAKHFGCLARSRLRYQYVNDGQRFLKTRPIISSQAFSRMGSGSPDPKFPCPTIDTIAYSPPFQGPMPIENFGWNGESFDQPKHFGVTVIESLRAFEKELHREDMIYEVKLEPGTCVIFENRRVAHARRAFTVNEQDGESGERWLRGAYVGADDYFSKLYALGVSDPLAAV